MEHKVQKCVLDEGWGFPVLLLNVPMVKIQNVWTPDIDYVGMSKQLFASLADKPSSFTGAEIGFIRRYLEKTLAEFGHEFGVSHVAVLDWEKAKDKPARINPGTELGIRLFMLASLHVSEHQFFESYQRIQLSKLADQQKARLKRAPAPLQFDVKRHRVRVVGHRV